MMVTDHSKANDELMAIAKTKNITLPSAIDAEHQKKIDELSKKIQSSEYDKNTTIEDKDLIQLELLMSEGAHPEQKQKSQSQS